jgi:hypothetical protein
MPTTTAYRTRQAARRPDAAERVKQLVKGQGAPHTALWTSALGHQKAIRGDSLPELRAKMEAFRDWLYLTQSVLVFKVWTGPMATMSVFPTNDANSEEWRRCHKAVAEVRRKGLTSILHTTDEGDWLLAKGPTYPRAVADEYRLMSSYPDAAADFRRKGARREVIHT